MEDIEKALASLRLQTQEHPNMSKAVSILADASKNNITARQGLADADVLKTLVDLVESSINDSLETTDLALRCIGNASIDNNEARETLTNLGFSWAVRCLRLATPDDVTTALLAAKVLYNICCDYEPAQCQCFNEHAHFELIYLCSIDTVRRGDDKTLLVELLFWICGQKQTNSTTQNALSEQHLSELLNLPISYAYPSKLELDEYAMLLDTCLLFIRDSEIQKGIVTYGHVTRVFLILDQHERAIANGIENEEDQKLLISLSNNFIWCLSDISALPEFSQTENADTAWVQDHITAIIGDASDSHTRLVTAACQVLGNMVWAKHDPSEFVEHITTSDCKLQEPLFRRMLCEQDTELLHAAAGLLAQLSWTLQVRIFIGRDENARAVLEKLCRHETPQLKQDGIKLLRALGRDCSTNQERFADLAREVMRTAAEADTTMSEPAA
jgi:hypothetical protein